MAKFGVVSCSRLRTSPTARSGDVDGSMAQIEELVVVELHRPHPAAASGGNAPPAEAMATEPSAACV